MPFQVGLRQTMRTVSGCLHFGQRALKGLLFERSAKSQQDRNARGRGCFYISLATQKGMSRLELHTRYKTNWKDIGNEMSMPSSSQMRPLYGRSDRDHQGRKARRTGLNTISDRHDYHKAYSPGIQRTVYWPVHGVDDLESSMSLLFSPS